MMNMVDEYLGTAIKASQLIFFICASILLLRISNTIESIRTLICSGRFDGCFRQRNFNETEAAARADHVRTKSKKSKDIGISESIAPRITIPKPSGFDNSAT